MISTSNLNKCVGCFACVDICPSRAISINSNCEGFLYPTVNIDKCCSCGLCNTVCQIDNYHSINSTTQEYFALINKNREHLRNSSSGGAFLAIAEYVFNRNGVVVGCSFDDSLVAKHIITYSIDECIENLCGSKYVQSNTVTIFAKVKELLQSNKLVLFVGTPCQVDALTLFLKGKPDNLITIDLICHGVSSPRLWKEHKEIIEKSLGNKINSFRFRGKEKNGWALYYYYYYGKKNRCKHGPSTLDRYYTDFLKGVNYRESCYQCKYANLNRVGDFTIGDFWGAEKYLPSGFDIHKGVSLLIVNNIIASKVLDSIKENLVLVKVDRDAATKENHNLLYPTPRPEMRNDYYEKAFSNMLNWEKEYTYTLVWKLNWLKSKVPKWIKKLIRR